MIQLIVYYIMNSQVVDIRWICLIHSNRFYKTRNSICVWELYYQNEPIAQIKYLSCPTFEISKAISVGVDKRGYVDTVNCRILPPL